MQHVRTILMGATVLLALSGAAFAANECYEQYASPGSDSFQSEAQLWIMLYNPPPPIPANIPLPLRLNGQTTVHRVRMEPHPPCALATELTSMTLTGNMFGFPVTLSESPTESSVGEISQLVEGSDFPAQSFFDVFVEISTPIGVFFNKEPKHMETTIDRIPPIGGIIYQSPGGPIDLYDMAHPNDPPVGQLLGATHTPIPTLSEWGAIIFGTLLLGSVVFYIWRRRRVVTA